MITIFEPRWKDKTVLIADWKIGPENDIEITCMNGDNRRYPQPFHASGEWLRQYPTEQKPYGTMRIVPLDKLLEKV